MVSIKIHQLDLEKDKGVKMAAVLTCDLIKNIRRNNYKKVYETKVSSRIKNVLTTEEILEGLFALFNTDKPSNYEGRSMSVSDIVELDNKAYYVDSTGFVDITEEWNRKHESGINITIINIG